MFSTSDSDPGVWTVHLRVGEEVGFSGGGLRCTLQVLHKYLSMDVWVFVQVHKYPLCGYLSPLHVHKYSLHGYLSPLWVLVQVHKHPLHGYLSLIQVHKYSLPYKSTSTLFMDIWAPYMSTSTLSMVIWAPYRSTSTLFKSSYKSTSTGYWQPTSPQVSSPWIFEPPTSLCFIQA